MAGKLTTLARTALLTAALVSLPAATAAQAADTPPAVLTPSGAVVPASAVDPLGSLAAPGDEVRLSDEESITRWAHPQDNATIRARPSPSAPPIARLRFLTEDGFPEVYVVLDGRVDVAKRTWLRIRVPKRPNGLTGWVLQDSLSELRVVRTRLVIDRTALRATLYRSNTQIWSAPVGVGAAKTPTPVGVFYIRERLRGLGGTYGPWAFGTSAYSNLSDWPGGGVVGIHGTNQPGLVPGRPSHGCVRVRNDKIRRLAVLMPVGTPVHVVR